MTRPAHASLAAFLAAALLLGCGEEPAPPPPEPPASAASADAPLFGSAVEDIVVSEAKPALSLTFTPQPTPAAPASDTAARAGGESGGGRTISPEQVKAVVAAKLPQVRACYERELKNREGLRGKVVLGWTIGANGRVSGAHLVKNGTRSSAMVPCMIRAVSSWTFPRAEAPFDVEYPFTFKPRD